jgi:predicted nucleotidyltransferase component of viral defense system
MIPRAYITEWQKNAPWQSNAQVEQDLIIERALVELFSNNFLRENLAFRGGTALHKIVLKPQVRYSEDIDLVQIKSGPIKPILQEIRKSMTFLGTKREVEPSIHNVTARYVFETEIEPVIKSKLKLEINTREHFTVLGWEQKIHKIDHSYFKGEANITSYKLEELLATKLRALYQRKKGRDLFDLYYAFKKAAINIEQLIACYKTYMEISDGKSPSSKEFLINMEDKMKRDDFRGDIVALLRPEVKFNIDEAYELIKKELIEKI